MREHRNTPNSSIKDTRMVVQGYLESCRQRRLSEPTLKWYKGYLIQFAELYPELPISAEVMQEFISKYNTSDERAHGCFRTLKAFYNYVELLDDDFNNPFRKRKVKPPRRERKEKPYLSLEQIKRLLEYPHHYPLWVRPCLYILADTGARIGEVANLTREEIYEGDNGRPLIKLKGKSGSRIVPLTPFIRDMILSLPGDKLFPGSVDWLIRTITAAFKKAGVPGSSSVLRHSFCSLWEGNIDSLRVITGHTSIGMIENYRHNKLGHASKEHQQYSPVTMITAKPHGDPAGPAPQGGMDTIIKLAEELGAAKERIKQLEAELLLAQVKGVTV